MAQLDSADSSPSKDTAEAIEKNHENTIYLKGIPLPETIRVTTDFDAAAKHAELVISATPTQAAMRLTPDTAALLQQLSSHERRLLSQLSARVAHDRERLRSVERFALFRSPAQFVATARAKLEGFAGLLDRSVATTLQESRHTLDKLAARLPKPSAVHAKTVQRLAAIEQRLSRAQCVALERSTSRLASLDRQLNSVGPLKVLERGYSVTLTSDGRALRSQKDAAPGTRLTTRIADGEVRSVVEGAVHAPLVSPSAAPTAKPRKQVKAVLDALSDIAYKELRKAGIFTMPGFAKFRVVKKPATKARQGINPFTKAPMTFAAKPASKAVRARPIKAIKDALA